MGGPMDAKSEFIIRMSAVGKVFLTDELETHALREVSLQVRKGEFVAVAGPSGCGKSTLLSIMGLLDTPTSGRYELAGDAVDGLSPRERARRRNAMIGFVFQSFNLIADLTILENVELPLRYGGVEPRERRRRAMEALERVGMAHRMKHLPHLLSGGQQQRVAVARSLIGRPIVVLADEPTGNLDSQNGQAVMDLFAELHESGSTICMVTHDPRYAQYARRVVQLFDGRVVGDVEVPITRSAVKDYSPAPSPA